MSNGGWRLSTLILTSIVAALIVFLCTRATTTTTIRALDGRTIRRQEVEKRRSTYDRPGTLSTFATRLDGNVTGEPIPFWAPFDRSLDDNHDDDHDDDDEHGRLLEKLLSRAAGASPSSSGGGRTRIVDPIPRTSTTANKGGKTTTTTNSTVLFFGDSNERAVVDEVCIKLASWPTVVSSKHAPARSDRWHSDAHVCDVVVGGRDEPRVRWASFMSYGVLVEKESNLWDKKLELEGPWDVAERIELAKEFVSKMAWQRLDLVVFNSNLWDLMYLHDTHLRSKTPYEFSLSRSTLEAYVSRAVSAVAHLAASFPSTPIYVRTLHALHPGREIDFFNERRVAQLNEAALEVVSRSRTRGVDVRLLDLARVLAGWPTSGSADGNRNILKDKVHLGWNPGLFMYGEMVLDASARVHRQRESLGV